MLDNTEFRSSIDVIFEGLRQAIVDDATGRSAVCSRSCFTRVSDAYDNCDFCSDTGGR